MTDKTSAGSAGHGLFRVTPARRVFFDPQGGDGAWAEGVTQTRLRGLVRDKRGTLALADLAAVDVTKVTVIPYATDGLSATRRWDGTEFNDGVLSGASRASMRIEGITRAPGQTGILHESGGASAGNLTCVFNDGVQDLLHFQVGAGDGSEPSAGRAVIRVPAPVGTFTVEWSADGPAGRAALYVDGVLVGAVLSGWASATINAGNGGELGRYHPVMPANPGGWTDSGGDWPGAIAWADIFLDQLTAEIA